ncbi:MAG: ATP-dependent helicase HrpB [Pseudomonadota bacterium]
MTQQPSDGAAVDHIFTQAGIRELPINALLPELRECLAAHPSLIIEAPPGAGKTTVVPLALLDAPWLVGQRILMLQPRRIAARNAAARLAELLGEKPGDTVGYRMRLDTRVGPATRIEVITEGVLRRMLGEDPSLDGVGLVIFDEFHERSLDADLSLALALKAREIFPDEARFRILVMSATLSGLPLDALLGAPCLRSKGRQFPVTVHYAGARKPRERTVDRVGAVVTRALASHPNSSILVFLPGQGEIRRTADALAPPPGTLVRPLYGDLSLDEQRRAIAAPKAGERKIVLATNVAETSLTIEGVDVVIDAGLERVPRFDPGTAMTRLTTVQISKASAEQRCGRAGRLQAGHCYRLWSETQQEQLAPQADAEIANADLAPLVLELLAWGIDNPAELRWLTPPPTGAWHQALDLLEALGAIEVASATPRLTAHGRSMAKLATHPRIAHLLLMGKAVNAPDTACLLAAVLSDRDPLGRESADMSLRLAYLQGERSTPATLRGWVHRSDQLAAQLRRQLAGSDARETMDKPRFDQLPGFLLACAYPDRIARRRHGGAYQLANGRSAAFAGPEVLAREKWLVVAEASGFAGRSGDTIRCAAALDPSLFDHQLAAQRRERTRMEWDEASGRFLASRETRIGALLLGSRRLESVDEDTRVSGLITLLRESELKQLPWDQETRRLRQRLSLMRSIDDAWPDFSLASLTAELELWLAPYLGPVRRLSDLRKLDLRGALLARLDWTQHPLLDEHLPERIEVPSGSKLLIDYSADPPVLAVKLQEMFGCRESPSLAGGRIPLMIHLLSPAGRPLQVTQDLASFWANGYGEVRREMKGRYPKHPWPEDPLQAMPTRHTKKRAGL